MSLKNIVIIILAVLLLGLGGWVLYDKSQTDSVISDSSANLDSSGNTASEPAAPTSKPENVIDLSNQGLTTVGSEIYNKTNTTELILSNNNIRTLPSEMGKMEKLAVFRIDHNALEGSLIGEIRKMPLVILDVSYNKMTGMPAEIGQLNKLESLNYSYNNITGLPNELENLKSTLKEFNLTGNPLSPDTLEKLKEMLPNTKIIF